MPAVNDTIGPYRLEREIGRGGMGVVFLSHDTRLDRPVAIKALPDDLADDPDRLARFEREAKTLAQLNHPNVAQIYGVEVQDDRRFLVLEYVEGETLEDRLERGGIPVDEAIEISIEICGGLDASHEAGVVHRDLKPANIKITPEGKVKVLDFGLAKADDSAASDSDVSNSPTVASPARHSPSIPGAILGTAPYMSPEQARGRRVDKRTDIWSFGVVLYEMLTGMGPFLGETVTDSIGAILHKDVDMGLLPPDTPPAARFVIRRCLERNKNERLRDIGDARLELEHAGRNLDDVAQPIVAGGIRIVLPWLLATIAAAVAGFALLKPQAGAARRLVSEITPPDGMLVSYRSGPPALSPDGGQLAFVAVKEAGGEVLCVRDLESGDMTTIADHERIGSVFWSPDGRSIGYFGDARLMVVETDGGKPEILTEMSISPTGAGAAWADDGTIVYGGNYRTPLMKVDRMSGRTESALDPFPDHSTDWPVWPSFLPDGDHFLFTDNDDLTAKSGLYVGSVSGEQIKPLLLIETNGVYVDPPGAVVYWRGGSLYAHKFDLDRLELVGDPARIATGVWWSTWPAHAAFSVTSSGRLAYLPAKPSEESRLVWYDRATDTHVEMGIEGSLWQPRLSHDGRRIAIDRTTDRTAGDIVVLDVRRGTELPLTRDDRNESSPIWSPDDTEIYFFRGADIYKTKANGTGEATLVYSGEGSASPSDISPDGRTLLYVESGLEDARSYLGLLDLESGESKRWTGTPANAGAGRFSPDGRWVAHESLAGGQSQVVVTSFPDAERRYSIATGLSTEPLWRADGKEIVYRSRGTLMSVEVDFDAQPTPIIGTPQVVTQFEAGRASDATPDLQRFIVIHVMNHEPGKAIRIVDNWWP